MFKRNIPNGASNYIFSKSPINNSAFDQTSGSRTNPLKPYPMATNSMYSIARTSAPRIRQSGFQGTIENNKYSGAKSSAERTQYLKKIAQGTTRPNSVITSYVSNSNTNKNAINSARQRVRNIGYRVPKKVGA